MKKYNSHILTVTTESAEKAANYERGFIPSQISDLSFEVEDISIMSRTLLEQDSYYKHIIPYIIISQDGKILTYQRTSSGGESRLAGNYSIGFGGHIDIGDVVTTNEGQTIELFDTIKNSAIRELQEELNLNVDDFQFQGLLYDDSNSVGTVHLGVVLEVSIAPGIEISSPEHQIDLKGFVSIGNLLDNTDKYENWSKAIIEYLTCLDIDV